MCKYIYIYIYQNIRSESLSTQAFLFVIIQQHALLPLKETSLILCLVHRWPNINSNQSIIRKRSTGFRNLPPMQNSNSDVLTEFQPIWIGLMLFFKWSIIKIPRPASLSWYLLDWNYVSYINNIYVIYRHKLLTTSQDQTQIIPNKQLVIITVKIADDSF